MSSVDYIDLIAGRTVRIFRCEARGKWVAEIVGLPNKVLAMDEPTLLQRVRNVIACQAVAEFGSVPRVEAERLSG